MGSHVEDYKNIYKQQSLCLHIFICLVKDLLIEFVTLLCIHIMQAF